MKDLIRRIRRHKLILAVSCLLFTIMCISCDKQEIYYRYHQLKGGEWGYRDTLVYDIDSTLFELNTPYLITIELTNNTDYPYQNIWLNMQLNLDNDSVYSHSSKEYMLADESGKWHGSGFGSLYQSSFTSKEPVVFTEKRNYCIRLVHGMRDTSLKGIEKAGIRLSKEAE